jgi:parallel beta-helix repeat protein
MFYKIMKITATSALFLTLFFTLMIVPEVKVVEAEPNTIVVPDDYATIQEAVNGAGEGDVVFVRSGTYHENVFINKSLSLIGENKSNTSIIGDSELNETAVFVCHDGVAIRDFTVKANSSSEFSGGGTHLFNVRHCNVSNCNFVIIGLGIIPFDGYGVWLYGSSENTVKDNQIDCTYIHRSYGLRLQDSPCNSIVGNTITKSNYGIVLDSSIGNNLTGNHVLDNFGGINVLSSNNNSMICNNIAITGSSRFTTGLTGYGISLTSSSNNIIESNTIKNYSDGVQIKSSSYFNLLEANTIADCDYCGIELEDDASHNRFVGNRIEGNQHGLTIRFSSNNTVDFNNLMNNGVGTGFDRSSNNTIRQNNFINNTIDVYDYSEDFDESPSVNSWDDGVTGNYWSNYNGTDNDGDGIGETPYIINENNQDNYPLIEPVIIPEFPNWALLLVILLVVMVVGVGYKQKLCAFNDGKKQNRTFKMRRC